MTDYILYIMRMINLTLFLSIFLLGLSGLLAQRPAEIRKSSLPEVPNINATPQKDHQLFTSEVIQKVNIHVLQFDQIISVFNLLTQSPSVSPSEILNDFWMDTPEACDIVPMEIKTSPEIKKTFFSPDFKKNIFKLSLVLSSFSSEKQEQKKMYEFIQGVCSLQGDEHISQLFSLASILLPMDPLDLPEDMQLLLRSVYPNKEVIPSEVPIFTCEQSSNTITISHHFRDYLLPYLSNFYPPSFIKNALVHSISKDPNYVGDDPEKILQLSRKWESKTSKATMRRLLADEKYQSLLRLFLFKHNPNVFKKLALSHLFSSYHSNYHQDFSSIYETLEKLTWELLYPLAKIDATTFEDLNINYEIAPSLQCFAKGSIIDVDNLPAFAILSKLPQVAQIFFNWNNYLHIKPYILALFLTK